MTDVKPTPGPWLVSNLTDVFTDSRRGDPNDGHQIADCQVDYESESDPCLGHGEAKANARLIAAACNSYQQHCADPVAAAEGDLLGEALVLVAELRDVLVDYARQDECAVLDGGGLFMDPGSVVGPSVLKARALLAKAEGKA